MDQLAEENVELELELQRSLEHPPGSPGEGEQGPKRQGCGWELPLFPVAIEASLLAQTVKNVCSARNPGSFPRLGRSPGEGNGYPLQ